MADVKFFWPIYVSSFIVGTIGVYAIAPLCRPVFAPLFGRPAPHPTAEAASVHSISPQAPLPSNEPAQTEAPTPESSDPSPAQQGIYLSSANAHPDWGVTAQQTPYYKSDGTRLGLVPGGAVFHFQETVASSKGTMLQVLFLAGGPTNGTFLVGNKDVHLFSGSYAKLSPSQQTALSAYYELKGKIVRRQNELIAESSSKNPFFAEYHTAYVAYTEHMEKAQLLSKKRERATNIERVQLDDQLREMKHKEVRLEAECAAVQKKFRAWKQLHAQEEAQPENDPSIQQWEKDLLPHQDTIPGLAF